MSADIGALFDERDSLEIARLVKAGEVTPGRARRRGDPPHRATESDAERGLHPALRLWPQGRGRPGAARRPVQGRALPAQGPRHALGGHPAGQQLPLLQGLRLPRRHDLHAADQGGGLRAARPQQRARVRLVPRHRARALRPHQQPLEPGADAGRLQRRRGGGAGVAHGALRRCERRRRLDAGAGLPLRAGRAQALAGPDHVGAVPRLLVRRAPPSSP